jgi:hypothetical protein
MSRILSAILIAALSACTFGPQVENEALARHPRGADIQLAMVGGSVRGELLDVRDTGLVVLAAGPRIVIARYSSIHRIDVEVGGSIDRNRRPPPHGEKQRLARLSRFPHGLTPEVERALLRAYGLESIEEVGQ